MVPCVESSLMDLREVGDEYPRLAELFPALYCGERIALMLANGTGYEKKIRPCSHGE
jgi:hypothetical protein